MYCPSCDKSYGAVHSRCPECHSWLKVSSPAGRGSAKKAPSKAVTTQNSAAPAAPAASPGGVSTVERKSNVAWGDSDLGSSGSSWDSGSDSWGGGSSASKPSSGGSSWGGDLGKPSASPMAPSTSSGWGGGSSLDSGALSPAASSWDSGMSATTPKAESKENSGWLGGGGDSDGWGGGGLAASAPATNEPTKPAAPSLAPAQPPLESSGTGWLADGPDDSSISRGQPVAESQSGWLSDSRTESVNSKADVGTGNGWLVDDSQSSQSMTEMVDRAIDAQESDDFVDDSWVDEEVQDGEFDDLDLPEDYVAPTPEVGSTFIKMLLVAALVLLVGGGVMYLGQDRRSPEELAMEQKTKDLEFARSTVIKAREDLKGGKSALAVPQFESALGTLEELQAPKDEIYSVTAELARAQEVSQDFEGAHVTWKRLAKGPESYRAEAKKGMANVSKQLRLAATQRLKDSVKLYANGESTSVITLGQEALEIFKNHQGNSTQLGKSHAVIARGYVNGRRYHKAENHFRTAKKLFPGGGYEKELDKIASSSRTVTRRRPGRRKLAAPPRRRTVKRVVKPKLGNTPGYTRRVPTARPGRRRSARRSAPARRAPQAAPRRMKEIPTYRPSNQRSSGGRKRAGSKNVLKTY